MGYFVLSAIDPDQPDQLIGYFNTLELAEQKKKEIEKTHSDHLERRKLLPDLRVPKYWEFSEFKITEI